MDSHRMEDADQRAFTAGRAGFRSRLGDAVEQLKHVPLWALVLVDGHKPRIVADSDAAFALFQGFLVTGSAFERCEAGRLPPPASAAPARHGERRGGADQSAEEEGPQAPGTGFRVHGSIEAWWSAPLGISFWMSSSSSRNRSPRVTTPERRPAPAG